MVTISDTLEMYISLIHNHLHSTTGAGGDYILGLRVMRMIREMK